MEAYCFNCVIFVVVKYPVRKVLIFNACGESMLLLAENPEDFFALMMILFEKDAGGGGGTYLTWGVD